MTSIDIKLDGDGCWPDLVVFSTADLTGVALLPDGEVTDGVTGKRKRVPVMLLRLQTKDGGFIVVQVKVEIMEMVMSAMRGRLEYLAELKSKGGSDS
jgi:hypothetical protein